MNPPSCPICFENYSEIIIPKSLDCGHTICAKCLSQILQSTSKCPECQKQFEKSDISQFPSNFALLHLIQNLGTNCGNEVNGRSRIISSLCKELTDEIKYLSDETESLKKEIESLNNLEEIDNLNNEDFKAVTTRAKNAILQWRQGKKFGSCSSEYTLSLDNYDDAKTYLSEVYQKTRGKEQLWVMGFVHGEKKYGKVESFGTKICVHSLSTLSEEEKDSIKATTSFQDLKRCSSFMRFHAFLKICCNNDGLEEFFMIELEDSLCALPFISLCTGEFGPSYKGSKCSKVSAYISWQFPSVQKHMFNVEEGNGVFKELIGTIHKPCGVEKYFQANEICVEGDSKGSFNMYKVPVNSDYNCLGTVIYPFSLNQNIQSENDDIKVNDCGIVLILDN